MEKYHFLISWNVDWVAGHCPIGKNIEVQLIKLIAREYRRENYPKDFMMPSVRILAKVLGVPRYLVERAYAYWIKREEILYSLDRQGTFMYCRPAIKTRIIVASAAQFTYHRKPALHSEYLEHQRLNMLTLGEHYPVQPAAGNFHFKPSSFLKDALGILRKRKLISNQRQFCVIPNGRAVYKVLEMITSAADLMVMTSIDDLHLVQLATQLQLNLAFSGTDEQGMSAVRLEEICQKRPVKVVFIRPEPDFPIPIRMTSTRWKDLVELSEKYGFCLLVLDEDYEFRSKKVSQLPISLAEGRVIYITPFSKIEAVLHRVGLVAGPEDFIAALSLKAKGVVKIWNQSAEKSGMRYLSRSELSLHLKKSAQCRKRGCFILEMMVNNYLMGLATLIYPGCGTFAFLKFKTPLHGALASNFMEHPLFHEEENYAFDPNEPIHGFRISLFIKDCASIEFSMKMIRSMLVGKCREEEGL
ncbi:aminotransferase-like domain-containing protein [Pedobacter gandavensis]|uniref:PLP-dependent aminotransferase family protein n=1 Tax=Pedobacter gandavensis TaxID=2679963 RepID=A0ABR6EXE7_9SPHI|nr:hypothetical protein [Pedobacter gandavensis]MBB2149920.1 hypothetical protein [Pedobacter gandavensis]